MPKKPVGRDSRLPEAAQFEAKNLYQRIFEAAQDGILVLDADSGEIREANPFLLNLLGYTRAELLGKKLWDIGLIEDVAASQTAFEELRENGYIRNDIFTLKTKAGRQIEVEFISSVYPVGAERVVQSHVRDISKRKRIEHIQSLAKFPAENPNPVLRMDRAGIILYANEASQLLLSDWGVRQGESAPQLWHGLVEEVFARGVTRVFQTQVGEKTFSFSVAPILEEGYVNLYGRDITENKELLRKIKAKDDLLKLTGQMAKVGGWEFDAQTLQGIRSDEVARIYGIDPEQETNVSIELSFYKSGSREKLEFAIKEALELDKAYDLELELVTVQGEERWVRTIGQPVKQGDKIVTIQGTLQDITEHRRTLQALQKSTQQLAILHEIDRGILAAQSPQQLAQAVLDRIDKILPYQRASIVLIDPAGEAGRVLAIHKDGETRFAEETVIPLKSFVTLESLQQGRVGVVEEIRAHPQPPARLRDLLAEGFQTVINVPITIQEELTGVLDLAARHLGALSPEQIAVAVEIADSLAIGFQQSRLREEIARHMTELEQYVAERTEQLKIANEDLEAFSYSVSHDLRAPLRAIDGFTRILLEEYVTQLPAAAQRYLGLVHQNAQQMGRLVDDLLAFSRLGRKQLTLQTVWPAELAREALEVLRPELAGRPVEIQIGSDAHSASGQELPACQADPALLKQVFVNLLSNALKFTRKRPDARIEIGAGQNEGECVYYVKDNGVGFDMQYYNKLFGVFQRLHRTEDYEGTGVGLATIQRIIHRHGGRVWAEAELEQGATFYFTLAGGNPDD